jgi:hypothetical protein
VVFVDIVLNCRGITVALVGDDVDHDRSPVGGGVTESAFQGEHVVPVDGAAVLEPEGLEERGGGDQLLERFLDPLGRLVGGVADQGEMAEGAAGGVLGRLIGGGEAELPQVGGDPADGRGVGAPVVVQDDDQLGLEVADVVERLVGHAAGQRAVTDHADHLARFPGQLAGRGQGQGVAEARGGVGVLDDVVLGLGAVGVPGETASLAKPVEGRQPPGQHLVNVGLVPGVEDQGIARRVEGAVEGDGQLHDPQVGPQVAPGAGDGGHQEFADLGA